METKNRIQVVFAIPTLSAGGAERVMSYVAQNLDKDKFETTLLVIGKNKGAAYPVENCNVVFLGKEKVRDSFTAIIKCLYRIKPHLVISAIAHLNIMMAVVSIFFPSIKFVGRETLVKSVTQSTKKKFFINTNDIQKLLLDAIICQSRDMKVDMIENFNFPEKKLTIIHNPVNENFNLKQAQDFNGVIKFITVGRLSKNKGHGRIISALSKFDRPFTYTIIGKGNYKDKIIEVARKLEVYDKIKFIEFTDEVSKYLRSHDIFLHGSYVEGFPNSMLESCAVGTPIVAFNAPGGINEIIDSGVNGFIVENSNEFLEAVEEIVSEQFLSPEKIRKSVIDKYSADKILKDYERFIEKIVNTD